MKYSAFHKWICCSLMEQARPLNDSWIQTIVPWTIITPLWARYCTTSQVEVSETNYQRKSWMAAQQRWMISASALCMTQIPAVEMLLHHMSAGLRSQERNGLILCNLQISNLTPSPPLFISTTICWLGQLLTRNTINYKSWTTKSMHISMQTCFVS